MPAAAPACGGGARSRSGLTPFSRDRARIARFRRNYTCLVADSIGKQKNVTSSSDTDVRIVLTTIGSETDALSLARTRRRAPCRVRERPPGDGLHLPMERIGRAGQGASGRDQDVIRSPVRARDPAASASPMSSPSSSCSMPAGERRTSPGFGSRSDLRLTPTATPTPTQRGCGGISEPIRLVFAPMQMEVDDYGSSDACFVAILAIFAGRCVAQTLDARPAPAVEFLAGYAGFVDDATIDHAIAGTAVRVYLTPRLAIGPEFVYMWGPNWDRDLFLTGNLTFDLLPPRRAARRVTPFLVAGGGLSSSTATDSAFSTSPRAKGRSPEVGESADGLPIVSTFRRYPLRMGVASRVTHESVVGQLEDRATRSRRQVPPYGCEPTAFECRVRLLAAPQSHRWLSEIAITMPRRSEFGSRCWGTDSPTCSQPSSCCQSTESRR